MGRAYRAMGLICFTFMPVSLVAQSGGLDAAPEEVVLLKTTPFVGSWRSIFVIRISGLPF